MLTRGRANPTHEILFIIAHVEKGKQKSATEEQDETFDGQETVAAVFSASSAFVPFPDSYQPTKSTSALPVSISATTIYVATKNTILFEF